MIKNEIQNYCNINNKQLSNINLLDIGSRTGNYSINLMNFVGKTCIEYNDGMISKLKEKSKNIENIDIIYGSAMNLNFNENSFDIIIINQVIHHLDGDRTKNNLNNNKFLNIKKYFSEIYKVLVKGGKFLMNFTLNSQLKGYWYIQHLIPQTLDKFRKSMPSKNWLLNNLNKIGFKIIIIEKVSENIMNDKFAFNTKLVYDKKFRDCDSIWSLVNEEEIKNALKIYEEIIDELGYDNFNKLIIYENQLIKQNSELIATK